MKYTLRIDYSTGNSFGSEDVITDLEITWDDLDIIKQNLRNIKEHYYMIEELENFMNRKKYDEILAQYRNKDWFVDENDVYMNQYYIYLKADNGNKIRISTFWIGHFEKLHSIEIILSEKEENDMKFEV